MDRWRKFGLTEADQAVNTCVIIVELEVDNEVSIMGALVDGVQEVLNIPSNQIEESPRLGSKINTRLSRASANWKTGL